MSPIRKPVWAAALSALALLAAACGPASPTPTDEAPPTGEFAPAEIAHEEGGPVTVTGEVAYTNPFFTATVAQPLILLEDQGGFVVRDRNFLFPDESQVLGKLTSDFYTSPFTYSIDLPDQPQGSLHDVDQDGGDDPGVMVFAVAYWTNIFGDPYLEKRDQYGGGWSSAYASTKVSDDRDNYLEVYGGKYLIFANEAGQGFPSGFGDDGLLFTADDPIVAVPQGWTLVDLDSEPFTFDRSRQPFVELFEPESVALADFSALTYSQAFDAMLEKMRNEYAFTEYKDIDWTAMEADFRPRFAEAEADGDAQAYLLALRDFTWSIPDGHVGMDFTALQNLFLEETGGGLGLAIREVEGGAIIVNFLTPGGPAQAEGIALGAEVVALNGAPIAEAVAASRPWSLPFSTPHTLRLQQLRYVTRFPVGTEVEITYRNPEGEETSVTLNTVAERDSFNFSSFAAGITGLELPVEFDVLDSGFGYVKVLDFFDNELLTVQLWERMIQELHENEIPGLIIDLRFNGGGSGYLAEQMAAYFFDEETITGNTGYYDDSTGEFYSDPGDEGTMFPPREDLRYNGPLAVIVGPACASACEFFAYALTLGNQTTVVGHYPTAGLGGSVEDFVMPEDVSVRFTIGRAVDPGGDIHIEGIGVVPNVVVPVTAETILNPDRDVLLAAAVDGIGRPAGAGVVPAGPPEMSVPLAARAALGQYLQGSGPPLLDDMALEDHGTEFAPGEYIYTVPLGASQDALWVFFWCTADEASFEDNWGKIEVEFTLGGAPVSPDLLAQRDDSFPGLECRGIGTVLSNWPAGEHVLEVTATFADAMNDGFAEYEAGVRHFEYHVIVTE